MKYRITVTEVKRYVIEGDSPDATISYLESRADELVSGVFHEEDHEVSSFYADKPRAKTEICVSDTFDGWDREDQWVEVVE